MTVEASYGFLPTSVWNILKSRTWTNLIQDKSAVRGTRGKGAAGDRGHLKGIAFSEFNPDLAERIIRYWSIEGDLIVDPFGGRAIRAIVAIKLKRNYIGYEIAPSAYRFTNERLDYVREMAEYAFDFDNTLGDSTIILGNGCKMSDVSTDTADMIFTCPPYHNLEKYESVEGQLSDIDEYEEFLEKISLCTQHCKRVLKPGKFAVWVVADWRRNGFKCFHKDCIDIFLKQGFELWDIVVSYYPGQFIYLNIERCEDHKYTSKTHEYVLVFRK